MPRFSSGLCAWLLPGFQWKSQVVGKQGCELSLRRILYEQKNWENSIVHCLWGQIEQPQKPTTSSFSMSPLAHLGLWAGCGESGSLQRVSVWGGPECTAAQKRARDWGRQKARDQRPVPMLHVKPGSASWWQSAWRPDLQNVTDLDVCIWYKGWDCESGPGYLYFFPVPRKEAANLPWLLCSWWALWCLRLHLFIYFRGKSHINPEAAFSLSQAGAVGLVHWINWIVCCFIVFQ